MALVLLSGTALAAVFVYKALFSCQVVVEPGIAGLTVSPANYDFGTMAVGDWSQQQMMTVKNVGTDTIVSFFFETNTPDGLGLYVTLPPIMPLAPGQEITFPISLKADDALAPGTYSISGKVIGKR